jgi:membrane protein
VPYSSFPCPHHSFIGAPGFVHVLPTNYKSVTAKDLSTLPRYDTRTKAWLEEHNEARHEQRRAGSYVKLGEFFSDLKSVLGLSALKRIGRAALKNDCLALAGNLAYLFVLFLFPFLMFLVSLVGLVVDDPGPPLKALIEGIEDFLPGEAAGLLNNYLYRTLRSVSPLTLVFATLITLGVGSAVAETIAKATNRSYGVAETRPFWKIRGLSVLLVFGFTLLAAALAFVVLSPEAGSYLQQSVGLSDLFPNLFWRLTGWAVAFLALTLALDVLYYVAPNVDLPFRWITPGGFLATVFSIVASVILRVWVANVFRYDQLYGQLGAGIVLLIWLYAIGLAVLIGVEINAVLARMVEERKGVELVRR